MGIPRLITKLEIYMVDAHVKDLKGVSVAVDTSGWIYNGATQCAEELARGESTDRYLKYVIDKLMLFERFGVIPIMVFDGAPLPAKSETSSKRWRDRKNSLDLAKKQESLGDSIGAIKHFKKAVSVTPDMVKVIVEELKRRHIEYVVAPYEADAQIAFLCRERLVNAVFSDDADMIPYGCQRIYRNLDWKGNCRMLDCAKFSQFSEISRHKGDCGSLNLSEFTCDMIRTMCVLSGCDYLKGRMTLEVAYELVGKYKNYRDLIEARQSQGKIFPEGYCQDVRRALDVFNHQVIYHTRREKTEHLSEYKGNEIDRSFLGQLLPDHLAKGIAQGDIDPRTGQVYQEKEELKPLRDPETGKGKQQDLKAKHMNKAGPSFSGEESSMRQSSSSSNRERQHKHRYFQGTKRKFELKQMDPRKNPRTRLYIDPP